MSSEREWLQRKSTMRQEIYRTGKDFLKFILRYGAAMKEIKYFQCDLCGASYTKEQDCIKCQRSHIRPRRIMEGHYNPYKQVGYPTTLLVEMEDGTKITYAMVQSSQNG